MKRLMEEARRLGVHVAVDYIPDPNVRAYFDPEKREIVLDMSLTMRQRKSSLGHELGHAYYGHTCSTDATEEQANRRAALLLIDPDAYARAERVSDYPEHIAKELGVTSSVIQTWREYWLPRFIEKGRQYG